MQPVEDPEVLSFQCWLSTTASPGRIIGERRYLASWDSASEGFAEFWIKQDPLFMRVAWRPSVAGMASALAGEGVQGVQPQVRGLHHQSPLSHVPIVYRLVGLGVYVPCLRLESVAG
ncbi:hypothetical protein CYMTET_5186 [Cymbomonas tetramitiformis]|uniref:Uncharacterized protein n=1 Tax=Cymbomonas tetramitiformis TaxID=36881 RepID=A0AAE0GZX3_9CHLO|nr:hypothetical protein CYMTET_5186 [Cymbomonas tetramitiformis]